MGLGLVFNIIYNYMVMKFIKKVWLRLILVTYITLMPIFSFAEGEVPPPADVGKITDPLGNRFDGVPDLIKTILEGVIKIGMPIVALAVIYCGFLFVFARGNPEKLTKAKEALTWTLVGAAILLGAWAIAKMISATVTAL